MKLRDHTQECDHGQTVSHQMAATFGGFVTNCPGGKLVEATPIPWCAEHDAEIHDGVMPCTHVRIYARGDEWMPCGLEKQSVYRIKGTT